MIQIWKLKWSEMRWGHRKKTNDDDMKENNLINDDINIYINVYKNTNTEKNAQCKSGYDKNDHAHECEQLT